MSECTVDGCGGRVVARGLCDKHRKRLARHGDVGVGRPNDWGKRTKHPLYKLWHGMMRRCYEKSNKDYSKYGGRGIVVAHQWHDFWPFVDDMGARTSSAHSVGRIDNNGPYSPENCRWETATQQARNKRNNVINQKMAVEIKRRAAFGDSTSNIARSLRLGVENVRLVIIGKTWT